MIKDSFSLPKAVIFDMDGLMLDTEYLAMQAFLKAGKQLDLPLTKQIFIKLIGINEEESNKIIEKELGHPLPEDKLSKTFYHEYDNIIAEQGIPLKPGLLDLLDYLSKKSIKCAVVTSTKAELATERLNFVKILHYFSFIIGGDQVAHGKPNPEPYLKAVQRLNMRPQDCIVLEDSNNGIKSGCSAGLKVIAIPDLAPLSEESRRTAYKTFSSLIEVKDFLS